VRILHLNNRLSARGGADLYLLDLIEAQQTTHVTALAVGRVDEQVQAPCPVHHVKGMEERDPQNISMDSLLSDFQPDVVHVHNVMNSRVMEALQGIPTLVTVHDHRSFCPGSGKWTLDGEQCTQAMEKSLCASCFTDSTYFDHILQVTQTRLAALSKCQIHVLSRYMKEELIPLGIDEKQITVIPPFVPAQPQEPPSDSPCVLFVGRLVKSKGIRDAIDAWEMSQVPYPLVFAGTGPERSRLESQGFEVLGWLSRPELFQIYRRATAVLMPSRWQEPFGIVGLEAMSFEVPVVTWNSGCISEWYPDLPLTPWGDVKGLAAHLKKAVGTRVSLPPGYEQSTILSKLDAHYEEILLRD
jgi:glycosyltransferase involved in cell wall biosynthesis